MNYYNISVRQFNIGIALVIGLFLASANSVFAVSAAPSPICEIDANIVSINEENNTSGSQSTDTKYYFVTLEISKVSLVSGDENPVSCVDLYPVGSKKGAIITGNDYDENVFLVGKRISSKVQFKGDERLRGSFLSDVHVMTLPPQMTKQVIVGTVVGGGDVTQEGLTDAPRKFVYQIKKGDSTLVNLSYISYPPSPNGNQKSKIRLSLYSGVISIGDSVVAQGSFDKETNTLIVSDEGDYIETSQKEKQIDNSRTVAEQNKTQERAGVTQSSAMSNAVSEKLIKSNTVNTVSSVSLQSDEKTYVVSGTKKGKMIFIIPVTMSIELKVDAETGAVKEVKRPWWSFLVKYSN